MNEQQLLSYITKIYGPATPTSNDIDVYGVLNELSSQGLVFDSEDTNHNFDDSRLQAIIERNMVPKS